MTTASDDVDLAIFHYRVRDRLPWREIGNKVNLSHVAAIRRFKKFMASNVPQNEIDEYRAEENIKIDEMERHTHGLFLSAVQRADIDAAIRAQGTLLRVHQHRAVLNGLNKPAKIELHNAANVASDVSEALSAYLAGVADSATETSATE